MNKPRRNNAKSLANLMPPIKPGECRNPKGRPRESVVLKTIRAGCKNADAAGEIFSALKKLINKGNIRAIELAAHYAAGKPVQSHELTGKDGAPLSVIVNLDRGNGG